MVGTTTQKKLQIHEFAQVNLERPTVIVGFPEVGLVGTIATSYLIEKLSLPELGYIESSLEPAVVVIQRGEPKFPIRLFGKGNLAVLVSDVPLTQRFAHELTDEIVRWSLAKKSSLLVGLTGIPSQERVNMEGAPKIFVVSTSKGERMSQLKELGVELFDQGVIAGGYALLLKSCLLQGQANVTLLAESHMQFPDPGAAAAIINVLNPLLSLSVDVRTLMEESEQIRLKMRELMSKTQQSMQQMAPQPAPRVYA